MPTKLILLCLLTLPALVFADANNGEFMGYTLGSDYPDTPPGSKNTTTGNLLIAAEDPVKPDDIKKVSLITTPVSRTISLIDAAAWYATEDEAREAGRQYATLLRAKYPDWKFGREAMDARMQIVEVNFDKAPYTLQLRLVQDEHEGSNMWRFSMSLGWQAHSKEWLAWQNMSATQQAVAKTSEREQLLNDSDVRGL